MLKLFWTLIRFHGDIRNANDTADPNSAESMTPWSLTQQCQWHRRSWLSGIFDPVEPDSAVSMTPQILTQWYLWPRGAWLSSVNDTTDPDSAVSMTPQSLEFDSNVSMIPWNLTQWCHWHRRVSMILKKCLNWRAMHSNPFSLFLKMIKVHEYGFKWVLITLKK